MPNGKSSERCVGDIAVYGQESNYTTWKLARLNLAIRGIYRNFGRNLSHNFHREPSDTSLPLAA